MKTVQSVRKISKSPLIVQFGAVCGISCPNTHREATGICVAMDTRCDSSSAIGFVPSNALLGNDLGQVVHTNVPLSLFTKQYNLVHCEGLYA